MVTKWHGKLSTVKWSKKEGELELEIVFEVIKRHINEAHKPKQLNTRNKLTY